MRSFQLVLGGSSMIQLYGVPWSRASRCIWMLEEIGEPYEQVFVTDTRTLEFLIINPNGKVPALVDGDVTMWESLAINLYLADRYRTDLSPKSFIERSGVLKWSFWAESELEAFFNQIATLDEITEEWYQVTLRVLDDALSKSGYLVGERFTVADINVLNMFNGPVSSTIDFSKHINVQEWARIIRSRPAAKRTLELVSEAFSKLK